MPYVYLMTETLITLRQSEEWFWNCEPRVLIALIEKAKEIKIEEMKTQSVFIASCVWGKNPDKLIKKEDEEVLGIDKPVDPSLLRGWY